MIVRRMHDGALQAEYGIGFQLVYPHGGEDEADWGFGRAVVPPGGATEPHHHPEHEAFILVRGEGRMHIDGEERDVAAGDVVLIPAGAEHRLVNASAAAELEFLDVYWPPAYGDLDR
jgi:mannose-6-phosphate isomerase-like protein (cupin superfamily)